MRVLLQRVREASVEVDGACIARIGAGLLVLVGVETDDGEEDALWLARKVARLRIFDDAAGTMNRDIRESGGELLAVSQFTLFASTRKGNRPSYIRAAPAPVSRPLYRYFIEALAAETHLPVATGRFGADMQIALINDGPVTLMVDSRLRE